MVQIISDRSELKHSLRKLVTLVQKNGGWLDERLIIRYERGGFSVHSKTNGANSNWIIKLPPACLLPTDQFQLSLAGDDIRVESHTSEFSGGRLDLLEIMLELWNQTGKIAAQKKTAFWGISESDPDLFRRLAAGRNTQFYAKLEDSLYSKDQHERLLIKGFLMTRTSGLASNISSSERTQMLMPIIELLNHHPLAPPYTYLFSQNEKNQLAIKKFCALPQTTECFVRYGYYDAYDLLLNYGYIESNTFFIRSIPMEISLPGLGTMKVYTSTGQMGHKNLPPQIADLGVFLPQFFINRDAGVADVGYLLIPQDTAPHALRRVLGFIIYQLDPKLPAIKISEFVEMAEKQVLAENTRFYRDLLEHLHHLDSARKSRHALQVQSAMEMANVQLSKLAKYPFIGKDSPTVTRTLS
ncbi:hypothetical protein SCL_1762 [Sulfuricaulis limicola]|uniref:Uncharacterized protein n=1 Tax=Sulfuricaulis limicola TaxID=1620215 RepID=A0A1B4XGW6_9GAMM|nr:hypothetical protein [Sulfuricaulis limicola]BAV34060.1 hypothetical protein SCL_1762 [Sulfuricaulis limicola]